MKVGFICPDGQKIRSEDCLNECRLGSRCCPKGYLKYAAIEREQDRKPSVTELIKGTRQAYLQRVIPYYVVPSDEAFAIAGTKGHENVEDDGDRVEYDGITGLPDEVDEDTIIDYKMSGSYQVAKVLGIKVEKKEVTRVEPDMFEWQMQLNMYNVILGSKALYLKVFAIVRDGGTFIAKNRGIVDKTYFIHIPKLSKDEVLAYFVPKRDALNLALLSNKMPDMCSDRECWGGVRCKDFCPVSKYCLENKYLGR